MPMGDKFSLAQQNDLILTLHLLKRTLLGVSYQDILYYKNKNLDSIIEDLLTPPSEITGLPVKDYSSVNTLSPDSKIAYGETWVRDYNIDNDINAKRKDSLKTWITGKLLTKNAGIKPKMFLFWCEHFAIGISKISEAVRTFNYYQLLYDHSMENYADMLTEIILDRTNYLYFRKKNKEGEKTRENYARFILSKYILGEQYASIISKEKIKKLSRLIGEWNAIYDALTINTKQDLSGQTVFLSLIRDKAAVKSFTKGLLEYFQSLLQNPLAATYLVRKLFISFISGTIDNEAEKYIIHPVSKSFQSGKFDIKIVLRALLTNEHFYHHRYQANLLKTPVSFMVGIWKEFMINEKDSERSVAENYPGWEWLKNYIAQLGQEIGEGHSAEASDSNEQLFVRELWFSNKNTQHLNILVERLLNDGFQISGANIKIDVFALARTFTNPADPDHFIKELLTLLYRVPVHDNIILFLKRNFLLEGEEQNEVWTKKWSNALFNSQDDTDYRSVQNNLRKLFRFLLLQPEYLYI